MLAQVTYTFEAVSPLAATVSLARPTVEEIHYVDSGADAREPVWALTGRGAHTSGARRSDRRAAKAHV